MAAVKPSMTGIWQSMSTASNGAFAESLESFRAVVREGHDRRHFLQEPLRHTLVHGMVLDQEDPVAAQARRPDRPGSSALGAGKASPERV